MIVDPKVSTTRRRCSKCKTISRNIKKTRVPRLFLEPQPEQPSNPPVYEDTASSQSHANNTDMDANLVAISNLVFPYERAIREQVLSMIAAIGETKLQYCTTIQMAASTLKLKGTNFFPLDICNEKECIAWAIKKPLSASISLRCFDCKEASKRVTRSEKLKAANKAKCVAMDSRVNMRFLDSEELKIRTSNLNRSRCSARRALEKVASNLQQREMKCGVSSAMPKHVTATMTKMAEDEETLSQFEESIFRALMKIEVEGNYLKGKSITRANAKRFVDTMAVHAKMGLQTV